MCHARFSIKNRKIFVGKMFYKCVPAKEIWSEGWKLSEFDQFREKNNFKTLKIEKCIFSIPGI